MADKVKKYWAEFLTPGFFVGESFKRDITSPDPMKVKWPKGAYAFSIYEREDVEVDGKVYHGEAKQVGPLYYHPDSKIETVAEATRNPGATETLIWNMAHNGYKKIIWTRWGNWPQGFDEKEMTILADGDK
ncbi:MAG: hypothetical protein PHX83_11850 [Acidobacteriia bacterium]|nr:hypothetical protein [Terriglobia bacterium]